MRSTIVYYSLTGHTEKLALAIGQQAQAACHAINDEEKRQRLNGALRSVWQTLTGAPAAIQYPAVDVNHTDLIFVGGPMWVGRPCAPIQTYLRSLQDDQVKVAFFMTMGASKPDKAFRRMADLCGKSPVATLAVTEDELKNGIDSWQIHNFVAAATATLPRAA